MRALAVLRQRGSAPVETIFAFVFVMTLALGVIQIAFSLYARNIVMTSTHEAARAAVERGRTEAEVHAIVRRVLGQGAGGVFRATRVEVVRHVEGTRLVVSVAVAGTIRSLGPFPASLPVTARAGAAGEAAVP